MNVAVIGSGIAGLGAALELSSYCRVTLFESQARAGGHANTIDVELDGLKHPVDTGFLVLNEHTYPRLLSLFRRLRVPLAASDMSFSASLQPAGMEWSGTNLNTVFAQRRNMLSPRFLKMLRDIVRFNRQATRLAINEYNPDQRDRGGVLEGDTPLCEWLDANRYGQGFRNWYLLPMAAAIWSAPMSAIGRFPIGSFARFFHNHGLLQIRNRPQWYTVEGGSQIYVRRILAQIADVRLAVPVTGVSRRLYQQTGKVLVDSPKATEAFDAVILACHSDQSLALLSDATAAESAALGAIKFQPNQAWLHTDSKLMPKKRGAWSSWNYLANATSPTVDPLYQGEARVSVTYWLNKLQPLPFQRPVLLTLNPLREPDPATVIQTINYEHPVFNRHALTAQRQIAHQQGESGTWFAGAWMGYGFHEDGLASGQAAAQSIIQRHQRRQEQLKVAAA